MKKEDKSEISSSLSSPVPRAGIEPARLLRTLDFESSFVISFYKLKINELDIFLVEISTGFLLIQHSRLIQYLILLLYFLL